MEHTPIHKLTTVFRPRRDKLVTIRMNYLNRKKAGKLRQAFNRLFINTDKLLITAFLYTDAALVIVQLTDQSEKIMIMLYQVTTLCSTKGAAITKIKDSFLS